MVNNRLPMDKGDILNYRKKKELSIYWYNKASELRSAAGALCGKSWNPVYFMLSGMALELIYKAIVVAKGNEPNTKSHGLANLAKEAGLKVKNKQEGLLAILTEAIIWYGRYPVPKEQEKLKHMSNLISV